VRGPLLMPRGGGSGSGGWHHAYWLWPLPADGPWTVACEWPAASIPLTRAELDPAPILAAAGRAQVIFEFPDPPDGHFGDAYTIVT
jgi:hypothetical protein